MVSYLRKEDDYDAVEQSLNPCCNGRWSRTAAKTVQPVITDES